MYDIIIFGGGIAGLTVAHELIKKNLKILVVEKDNDFGGMARSNIEKNNLPSEHSWRGYAPFYNNTFQLMKEIPYNTKTVYDNLTIPIEFYLLHDNIKEYRPKLSFNDYFILSTLGANYLLSDKRREKYYTYQIEPFLKKNLSRDGYDMIINFITGPGYGMNKNEVSLGHLFHFMNISIVHNNNHLHDNDIKKYNHTTGWHVTNGPTNDVWINPWVKYLYKQGVDFANNMELVEIIHENNKIISTKVKQGTTIKILKARDYVIAINPYNSVDIFKKSNMDKHYNTFSLLTNTTKSKQISFRIGINKNINYPIQNIAFVMNDSEFNITWYPQEKHWTYKLPIKSLWSGTIIDFEKNGLLFNKTAELLNTDELKQEIIFQILRSKSFQKIIYDNNNFNITKEDIDYIEIWYEWDFINNKQEPKYEKWVNNCNNEKFRPSQETEFENMFLSGSHTQTTIVIWSMEGAVESGKITANLILNKYNKNEIIYYKHLDPLFIRFMHKIDNILYNYKLPNILNVILFIIIMIIVFFIYKTIK